MYKDGGKAMFNKQSKFKNAYNYFEEKILEPLLIVSLIIFSLLAIYAYLDSRTNYLNYL
jgi:hypothetical protein